IAVSPGAATQLIIIGQPPATVSAGTGFGLSVAAEDAFNNLVPSFTGNVAVALTGNPGSSTLAGTLTATAIAGVASFAGLSLNLPGSGYTLQAASLGLTSATSN